MKKANVYNFLLFLAALIVYLHVSAQTHVITGIVKDSFTMQPVAFCNIKIAEFTNGTTSNAQGRFNIPLSGNSLNVKLIVSSLNYINDTIQLISEKNDYTILLKPSMGFLNEIIVTG